MNVDKTFTVVGTSTSNGISKVRFANDLVTRTKTLQANDHTNISLYELPKAMTKAKALAWLTANPQEADQDAIGNKAATIDVRSKKNEVSQTPRGKGQNIGTGKGSKRKSEVAEGTDIVGDAATEAAPKKTTKKKNVTVGDVLNVVKNRSKKKQPTIDEAMAQIAEAEAAEGEVAVEETATATA